MGVRWIRGKFDCKIGIRDDLDWWRVELGAYFEQEQSRDASGPIRGEFWIRYEFGDEWDNSKDIEDTKELSERKFLLNKKPIWLELAAIAAPRGHEQNRKPDLLLIDQDYLRKSFGIHWVEPDNDRNQLEANWKSQ